MDNLETSSDILATNRILYGQGGYGYGNNALAAGNSVLAAEAHANGTALDAKTDCNAIRFSDGLNSLASSFENQTRANQIDSVNKNITDAEFRGLDRQRDLERLMIDGQKEAAQCCCDAKLLAAQNACETQKLVTSEATATRTLILEVEGRANVRLLDAANAKITQLETINALK